MLKKLLLLIVVWTMSLFSDTIAEINHLLKYVKSTECKYIRNGSVHSGAEAATHIKKKYNYFKDDIKTAEDFIRLSATKSTMTGSKYYIQCPKRYKIESQKWLFEELKKYRKKRK